MTKIFISYRRQDTRYQAKRIYDALERMLPREHLFMDIDSIPPGADFVEILEGWVGACEVMLALIGSGWVDATDPRTGLRRLDNPHDFVRIEIREALRRGILVVPVLLDEASMPDAEKLPDDLRSFVRRQADFIQFRTFDADVARRLGVASADAVEADAGRPRVRDLAQQSREQQFRADGRIPVLVGGRNQRQTRWLLPGRYSEKRRGGSWWRRANPSPGGGEWFCDVDGGPEMVVVPAGRFMMGSPENEPGRDPWEGPRHEVTFARPFAVGCHAVTRGQFAAFVNATGHKTSDRWRNPGFKQDDSHPVAVQSQLWPGRLYRSLRSERGA